MIQAISNFFTGVLEELRKVKWPSRNETVYLTILVLASVVVFMLFFNIIDIGLDKVIQKWIIK